MTNEELADGLGWLDENGVCQFPEDVIAVCSGYIAKGGIRTDKLSPEKLQEAIDRGWIKFLDGNGDPKEALTFKEFCEKYPEYPDPIWQLGQNDRWPPKKVFHIGRS